MRDSSAILASVLVVMSVGVLTQHGCAKRIVPTRAYLEKHGTYRYRGSQRQVFEAVKRALVVEGYSLAMSDARHAMVVTKPKLINVSFGHSILTSTGKESAEDFSIRLTVRVIDSHRKAVTVRITPTAYVGGVRNPDFAFRDKWLRRLLNTLLRSIWDEIRRG